MWTFNILQSDFFIDAGTLGDYFCRNDNQHNVSRYRDKLFVLMTGFISTENWKKYFSFKSSVNQKSIKIMKTFVVLLIFALAASTLASPWREGTQDSRCPIPDGDFATKLPGTACGNFFICNGGYRCEYRSSLCL